MAEKTTILEKQRQMMNWIQNNYQSLENEKRTINPQGVLSERRILLLGRSKSGKTTFRRMMRDPTCVSDELSLLDTYSNIDFDVVEHQQTSLSLKIVDTQSLSGRADDTSELTNIHKAVTVRGITDYHFICYCLSFEAGIRQQDINAIRAILTCYGPQIRSNLCMIITRCEMKTEEQRQQMNTQIQRDTSFRDLVPHFGLGIHFSGALKYDDWQNGNEVLCEQFQNIYEHRQRLLQLFGQDLPPCSLQIQYKSVVDSHGAPRASGNSPRDESEINHKHVGSNVSKLQRSKSGPVMDNATMKPNHDDSIEDITCKLEHYFTKRQKLIERIQGYYSSHVKNCVVPVDNRNIAIVNTKGTGKSDIVHMLVDPTVEEYPRIYPIDERRRTVQSMFVEGVRLVLNMIEIPFESIYPNDSETELNNNITQILETCIKSGFTRIDLICFVINQSELDTSKNVETMRQLMAYADFDFPQLTCLIITHSQLKTEEEQTKQIGKLTNHLFKREKDCFKRGIVFADSIRYEEYLNDSSHVMEHFATIMKNRGKLMNILLEKSESFPIEPKLLCLDEDSVSGFINIRIRTSTSHEDKRLKAYPWKAVSRSITKNISCIIL